MKLVTKYSVVGILLLAISVVLGGYTIIQNDFNHRINAQSKKLDLFATKIEASNDPLSSALLQADEFGSPLSVIFMTSDGTLTSMVNSSVVITKEPKSTLRDAAETNPQYVSGKPSYLLRAIELKDTDYVLIAEDVESIASDRDASLISLGIMAVFVVLLGGALITILVRFDMRSVLKTLQASADHERETRKAMQTFMGDASHELRTPLTVIKGYAEMLTGEQKVDKAGRQKAYNRIVEQVDRMDETIGSLLQLAEAGSVSPNSFTKVELSDLVANAVDDLETIDQDRPITRAIVDGLKVKGAPDLLGKLLNNAIGNVHRHTSASTPVRVSLRKAGRNALLIIEDGGPGLPAEAYDRGIQGFQRFDASRSRASGGTGLGMAIMNSIVEAHTGTLVLAKSDLGGLKLEITLPLN